MGCLGGFNTKPIAAACRLLVALCAIDTPALATPFLNLQETFAPTRQRLESGQDADILFIGDSISFKNNSYLPKLRTLMQYHYGDGGYGYQGFSLWSGAGFNGLASTPASWTLGQVNADTPPHHSLDGLWSSANSPLPAFPFHARFDAESREMTLHYLAQPGGGGVRIDLPEGSNVVLNTDSVTPTVMTFSHTFTGDNHRIYLTPDGTGPVTILGADNRSGDTGIRLHRAANGGWGVDNFLNRDFTFDQQLRLIQPGVVAIWLGQNDQMYSRSTYAPKLMALLDRLGAQLPDARFLLIGSYDTGGGVLPGLVEAMEDVAIQRSVGFINLYELGRNRDYLSRNGYLADGVHLSEIGGNYFSDLLFDVIHPALSEPGDLNFDGFVGVTDLNMVLENWNTEIIIQQLTGDMDGDNFVGVSDLNILLSNWNTAVLPGSIRLGDINGDGFVGLQDLSALLSEWNESVPLAVPLVGDITRDGFVGLEDLNIVLGNWNAGTPPPAEALAYVPEPGVFVICCVAGPALLAGRTRPRPESRRLGRHRLGVKGSTFRGLSLSTML